MNKPRRYAEGTNVPVEKTKSEIETLLRRHGATGFASAWDEAEGLTVFQCRIKERMIKFEIADPDRDDFKLSPQGYERSDESIDKAMDQELRRRWRSRLLITKAKLEMVEAGDTSFEAEFMADIMLPDGSTVGRWLGPQIEQAYTSGHAPKLLAAMPGPKPRKRKQ